MSSLSLLQSIASAHLDRGGFAQSMTLCFEKSNAPQGESWTTSPFAAQIQVLGQPNTRGRVFAIPTAGVHSALAGRVLQLYRRVQIPQFANVR